MFLNLNGSFLFLPIHHRRVLIELYSGKCQCPSASYVLTCCEWVIDYLRLTSSYFTAAPDSHYRHSDNRCDKNISLSYQLYIFRNVRHSILPCSSTTLIVVDNCSRSHETPVTGTDLRIRTGPIPLNRMEVTVRTDSTELDKYPTSHTTYVGNNTRGRYKAHEVSLKDDVESGLEEK